MADTKNLAAALVAVQANLPSIRKTETAKIATKDGSYSYSYADLAGITEQIMPLLTKHGLAFSCCPTAEDGVFVLAYRLLHTSGESLGGRYPLPSGTPQQVGSAITYARRYCLCAVVGVAPEDDDGQAASQAPPAQPPKAKPEPDPEATDETLALINEHLDGLPTPEVDEIEAKTFKAFGVKQWPELTQPQAEKVLARLREKAQEAAA